MRFVAIVNSEVEGWDIIDTNDWTSDVEDERENPVMMTIWDGRLVPLILNWLNG